jgi:hypothetical protein
VSEQIRFVRCQRCNLSMRVRVRPGNPDALLMQLSPTGEGLCASCAATLFLHDKRHEHIKHMIDEKRELLLWEAMQQQFASLMQAGNADARPEEINWQSVHDNWELPFARAKRGKK